MSGKVLLAVCIVISVTFSNGLFIGKRDNSNALFITYVDDGLDLVSQFPSKFWANFRHSDTDYSIKFERVTPHVEKIEAVNVENGDSVHHETKDTESYANYIQSNVGGGFATLVRNKAFDALTPFTLMASIFVNETTSLSFEVNPQVVKENGLERQKRSSSNEAITSCSPNPCQNGGACMIQNGLASCSCPSGFTGCYCEISGITCSLTCYNGGFCYLTSLGTQACSCPAGTTGNQCQNTASPCASNPCQNGGVCVQTGSTSFYCACSSSCSGPTCSTCSVPTTSPCVDFDSYLCNYFKGYCELPAYLNFAPIKVSCPRTCNSCNSNQPITTTRRNTCVDSQANCVYWANACHLLPNQNICARTCRLC